MGRETSDRNDPGINRPTGPGQQNEAYLVLSEEERAKGFVRPLRVAYKHDRCGAVTYMSRGIAETYARDPRFYGGTWCVGCCGHFPVDEFTWDGADERVGS